MTTKMKGLFKGLRYISQIFEEDKEQEMQIGFPTDVKHVAHIGWDGPSVESPSWMKEFKSPTGSQSAPLGPPGDSRGDPEIKWVSEESRRGARATDSPGRDPSEAPRSSRRHHHSGDRETNSNDSPRKKDSSTKSRQPRRNHSKDSSEGGSVKSNRDAPPSDSPSRNGLPDIPKKSRRKKSKESVSGGGSSRSRSKPANCSDNGPENEEASSGSQRGRPAPGGININDDEEKERRVNSKEY
ncbi:hypothetical protein CDL12_22753 [Handroanthus impetiginosus]|uniref:CRIB domain-containing protein n=1 Tax=Handroanthus impetiginosus TaxID=429701 RepID=A0A2G9GHN5_9LAMI|nr:hypothetical protein CDL12_22753 [Handroanthus impetiginosus]